MARGCRVGHGGFYWHLAELALEGLATKAIAGVAGWGGQVRCECGQLFGELLEQAMLANQVFKLLVIGQQAADQFVAYGLSAPHKVSAVFRQMTVYTKTLTPSRSGSVGWEEVSLSQRLFSFRFPCLWL